MLIGKLAELSGFTRDTIRYYERRGLIRPEFRRESNYREFGPEALSGLKFIKQAKELGFSLNEIKELIRAFQEQSYSCDRTLTFVNAKLESLEREIVRLQRHKKNLRELVDSCQQKIRSNQCSAFEKLWEDEPCSEQE